MIKVAVLDDYQNAFQQIVDVENYKNKFDFKVFNQSFTNEKEATIALEDFEALFEFGDVRWEHDVARDARFAPDPSGFWIGPAIAQHAREHRGESDAFGFLDSFNIAFAIDR